MKVSFEDHDTISVLTISGSLTIDQQDSFRRTFDERLDSGIQDFVLDIEHLTHVDSTGLEMLLWLQDEATRRAGRVKLVNPEELVRIALHVTRLEGRFDVHDSVEAAAKSLRG